VSEDGQRRFTATMIGGPFDGLVSRFVMPVHLVSAPPMMVLEDASHDFGGLPKATYERMFADPDDPLIATYHYRP
jgi:hypothetical protein